MHARLSPELNKELIRLKKKNPRLVRQVQTKLKLFSQNPQHASLRAHKLSGKLKNMWSIAITYDIRMVYLLLDNDEAYFVDLGTHDEVYKK